MSVSIKLNDKLYNIKEAVIKQGGVLIKNIPLKMKINGVIIDFIKYGYTKEDIKMLINIKQLTFDSDIISQLINLTIDYIDTVVITFENGTFLCKSPIYIKRSNVSIIGSSNTILTSNIQFPIETGLINFIGEKDKEIENIFMSGLTIEKYGIRMFCVGKSNINTTNFYNENLVGDIIKNKNGINIKNCILQNNNIGIYSYSTSNSVIENCILQNNDIGISSSFLINSIISNNTINNNNQGINLNNSYYNICLKNTIKNIDGYGIFMNNAKYNNINNNTIKNNYNNGLHLLKSFFNNITNNNIANSDTTGLLFDSSNNNIVSNNIIINNQKNGIEFISSTSNSIIFNSIKSNNGFGILLNNTIDNLTLFNITINNIIN